MADYWIKLYHEILDDPKMATLPDRLWRRTIELFLLAGKEFKDGNLPDTRQIAWALRMSMDDLDLDLVQIERTGMIKRTETGWRVVNFTKRQAPVQAAERMRQMRQRKQKEQYYDNTPIDVTNELRNVTQIEITDTDTDRDADSNASLSFDEIQACLEVETGVIPTGQASVNAIDEMVKMGVTRKDIENGVRWYIHNRGVVRYYASLVGPIQTEKAKRVQQAKAKPKGEKYSGTIILPGGQETEVK